MSLFRSVAVGRQGCLLRYLVLSATSAEKLGGPFPGIP